MPHNGGNSQVVLWFPIHDGGYPFIDVFKTGQGWTLVDNSGPPVPTNLSVNGFPTAGVGTYTVCYGPLQANRPGNWIIDWIGDCTIRKNFSHSVISGSATGVNGRCVILPVDQVGLNDLRFDVGIASYNAGNPVTQFRMYHEDDEAALLAGEVFSPFFKQRLTEANFGVIRFLDWQLANTSFTTKWADRKPLGYAFYAGQEPRGAYYAGTTTNISDAYSVGAPSTWGGLVDKAIVLIKFNASSSGLSCTLNVDSTGDIELADFVGDYPLPFSSRQPVADRYAVCVYDADLNRWLKIGGDTALGSQFLDNGIPPELFLQLCEEIGAHPWVVQPFLTADPVSDYMPSLATYYRDNQPVWMIPRFECTNETWNSATGFYATRYGWNKQLVRNGGATSYNATGFSSNGSGESGTSTITIGAHSVPVGANITLASFGGVFGFNGSTANVVSIGATDITINRAPTGGTYTSGGTVTGVAQDTHNWYGTALSRLGQAVSVVYGTDRARYQVICGVQTFGTPSAATARLESKTFVLQGGTAASNWVTDVAVANYIGWTYTVSEELAAAFEYSTATTDRKTEIATEIVLSALDVVSGSGIPYLRTTCDGWRAWALSYGVHGFTAYEGGWSPDYLTANTTATISGVSKAAQAVVTLSVSQPVPVDGMSMSFASVGGMVELNGNTYTVASVAGQNVTIDVNSTGFTTYTSGGTATYVNSMTQRNVLRAASKNVVELNYVLGVSYDEFRAAGGRFPSCYLFSGANAAWPVLDPDVYVDNPPQWEAIVAFNKRRFGVRF